MLKPSPRLVSAPGAAKILRPVFAWASVVALVAATDVALSPSAFAQVVTGYNSLAAYNAVATTTAVFGFEGIAPANGEVLNPSVTPLTMIVSPGGGSGVNYYVNDGTYDLGNLSLNGTSSLIGALNTDPGPSPYTTTLAFGNSVTAFGTEFGFRDGSNAPFLTGVVSVQLYNGATAVGTAFNSTVPNTETFIGLTSTQSFDRATFIDTAPPAHGAYQTFDNVRIGSASGAGGGGAAGTPEPSAIALLALSGLPAVSMIARRRRKSA